MKREVVKACIGFFFLGLILGGMYYGVQYLLKEDVNQEEAVQNYWKERLNLFEREIPEEEVVWQAGTEEIIVDEENPEDGDAGLVVRGRVLNADLKSSVDGSLLVVLDENRDKTLSLESSSEGWFVSSRLDGVKQLTVSISGADFSTGSFDVSGSYGKVRLNWILRDVEGNGKIFFYDAVCVEIGDTLRIYYHGAAKLPDGTVLVVSLNRQDNRFGGGTVEVEEGRFFGVLQLSQKGFPSGVYTLSLDFNTLDQTAELVDLLHPDETSEHVDKKIYIGDVQEEVLERKEEKTSLRDVVKRAQSLRRRVMFFVQLGLTGKGMPCYLIQEAQKRFPQQVPQLSCDGKLNVKVWRFWMDSYFLPQVNHLRDRAYEREVPVNVKLAELVRAYIKNLKKLISVGSMRVYAVAGLEPDGVDYCSVSLTLDDEYQALVEKLIGKRNFGKVLMHGLEAQLGKELRVKN